jgi:hypothetical protein
MVNITGVSKVSGAKNKDKAQVTLKPLTVAGISDKRESKRNKSSSSKAV